MVEAADLVGTWQLVSWESRDDDGTVTYPYGRDAVGYLIYSADGYMAVEMMAARRPPFAGGDILRGTVAERAEAAATYRSYCARWEFLGDRVRHHFAASLFPNRTGTSEERYIEYRGTCMTLTTPPLFADGKLRVNRLVWERADLQW